MISTKSKFGIERYFNVEKIYEKLFWFIHLLYIVTHCEKKIKKKQKINDDCTFIYTLSWMYVFYFKSFLIVKTIFFQSFPIDFLF